MLLAPEKSLVNNEKIIICYCAAWCRTCDQYKPMLEKLSQNHTDWTFIWLDIEEHPEWLIDDDIEDFPTILIQDASGVRFFGVLLPHIEHLEKLLLNLQALPVLELEPINAAMLE